MRCRAILRVFATVMFGLIAFASAQQAHQSIALTAYLKPSVRLSDESVAVNFRVTEASCSEVSLPLEIAWNLDRLTRQVQIIASFSNSISALSDAREQAIPASAVEARIGESPWKRFPETRFRVASSGLLLTTINISESEHQAYRRTQLQFRLCGQRGEFAPGEYHGRIDLRTTMR